MPTAGYHFFTFYDFIKSNVMASTWSGKAERLLSIYSAKTNMQTVKGPQHAEIFKHCTACYTLNGFT